MQYQRPNVVQHAGNVRHASPVIPNTYRHKSAAQIASTFKNVVAQQHAQQQQQLASLHNSNCRTAACLRQPSTTTLPIFSTSKVQVPCGLQSCCLAAHPSTVHPSAVHQSVAAGLSVPLAAASEGWNSRRMKRFPAQTQICIR